MTTEYQKVRVGNEDVYLIEFPVGDWSRDGHNQFDSYIVKSKKPVHYVREAHFRAPEVLGFDIGDICHERDDSIGNTTLGKKYWDKLKELKYETKVFKEFDKNGLPTFLSSEDILDIWLYFLNHIDSSLNLEKMEKPKIPSINFYGFDRKNRHLKTPGYNLFLDY